MAIEFRCSQCSQLLRVPDDSAGKNARCPKCQSLMTVPAASTTSAPLTGAVTPFSPSPLPSTPASFAAPPSPPKPASGPSPFAGQPAGGAGGGMPPPPSNPFAGLGTAPPPKPGESPFGSAAPPTSTINPYASPGGGYGYQPGFGQFPGDRPGLPWETQGQNFATWWATAKLCMMQPTYAFRIMRLSGGMGQPMMYSGMGLGVGFVGQLVWNIPLIIVMGLATQNGQNAATFIGIQIVSTLFQGAFAVAIGATIGLLIGSGIIHLCLMIVGGARQQYEATLRVLGYAQGSTAWLQVIPFVGPVVGAIWALVLEVIGLAQAHDIPTSKALLAVLLPIIFCCVVIGGLVALVIAFGAAAGAGAFK